MGQKFFPLDREQVEQILTSCGFIEKRQRASHAQWEGYVKAQRRIVTVDHMKSRKEKYGQTLLRKMIEQSGLSKKEFYSYLKK
jgi:predicted RNA binding protein YcfA (HicA-like mRNA interferase family)